MRRLNQLLNFSRIFDLISRILEDKEKSLDAPLSYSDTLPLVPSSIITKDGPIPTPNIRYRRYQGRIEKNEYQREVSMLSMLHVTCPRFVS